MVVQREGLEKPFLLFITLWRPTGSLPLIIQQMIELTVNSEAFRLASMWVEACGALMEEVVRGSEVRSRQPVSDAAAPVGRLRLATLSRELLSDNRCSSVRFSFTGVGMDRILHA